MSARAFYAWEFLVGATVLAATFAGGCANLEVKKVPLDERAAHQDNEQGFRYYLNRPYLLVKKAILVKETRSLVIVKNKETPAQSTLGGKRETKAQDVDGLEFTFVTGPRCGQTVRLADLRVENPGTGACREFTAAELQTIAAVVKERTSSDGGNAALPGDQTTTVTNATLVSSNSGGNSPGSQQGSPSSGSQNTTSGDVQQPTLATVQHTPPLSGDIGVVYLPDLDEQYVIKSCNFASKSSFALAIRNGSELVEVQGDHDSTALPLNILQQIQNAIQAAVSSEQSKSQQSSSANQQGGTKPGGVTQETLDSLRAGDLVFQMIERTLIKPGVYRLNKPWETDCGGNTVTPVGCGLLAKLGLPYVTEVDFQPSATITRN
ncbi:MAG TPA: hypothetical protein VKU02_30560 [Gemmataceae bacterium]|nr:hypothetical protein [Gemmataceae bacterium]